MKFKPEMHPSALSLRQGRATLGSIAAFLVMTLCASISQAQVGGVITLTVANETGRTAIARNVKAEGANLVAIGCYRWIPSGSTCQVSLRKVASVSTLKVDFGDKVQVLHF